MSPSMMRPIVVSRTAERERDRERERERTYMAKQYIIKWHYL